MRWKQYQSTRLDERRLGEWFGNGKNYGMAVILGDISGGLVCRDFDTMEGYERWAAENPDLAKKLPTVATARGWHVYFQLTYRGIKKLADGELRGAGYCLLPPSRHPDGPLYRWLIPLPDGPLPVVEDVRAAGFLDAALTERTEDNRENGSNDSALSVSSPLSLSSLSSPSSLFSAPSLLHEDSHTMENDIEKAIIDSLPSCIGNRNRQVFDLARALKAIPGLADAPMDALKPYVLSWHDRGVGLA